MKNAYLPIFLLITLINSRLPLTDFAQQASEACRDVNTGKWKYTELERSKLRKSSNTPNALNYNYTRQFLEHNDYSAIVRGNAFHFTIMIILIAGCLFSFIYFFIYCFCFQKHRKATEKKAKPFLILSIISLIGFLIFCIASVVYFAKLRNGYKQISCIIHKVPADIMQGISEVENEYIGLRPLNDLISTFPVEVYFMKALATRFNQINRLNIRGNARSPVRALPDFFVEYRGETTTDGKGFQSRPISVRELSPGVSPEIEKEFNDFSDVGISLGSAAIVGLTIGNNDREDTYADVAKTASEELTNMIIDINEEFTIISGNMDTALEYSVITYYFGFGIGITVVALALCLVIVLLCQSNKQRCMGRLKLIKTFLIIMSFITLCFATISILLFIVSTAVASYCKFQRDMLNANDVTFFLNQYELNLNPSLLNLISRCVTSFSTGSISDLLGYMDKNGELVDDVQTFYDGFISYQKLYNQIHNNNLDSVEIMSQVKLWRLYADGYNFDHENVQETIEEFNDLLKCQGIEYVLNKERCSGKHDRCEEINLEEVFIAPECTKRPERIEYLAKVLKTYLKETQELMMLLETNLASTEKDTANKRFRNLKRLLREAKPYYLNIKKRLPMSFGITRPYKTKFNDFVNCKRIRQELEDLEAVVCFHTNREFYFFFIMIVCSTFMLFLMNLFIFIALKCVPDDTPITLKAHKSNDITKIYFGENAAMPI